MENGEWQVVLEQYAKSVIAIVDLCGFEGVTIMIVVRKSLRLYAARKRQWE